MNISRNFVKAFLLSVTLSNASWGVNLEPEPTNTNYKNLSKIDSTIYNVPLATYKINYPHNMQLLGTMIKSDIKRAHYINYIEAQKIIEEYYNKTKGEETIINHLPFDRKTEETIPNTEITK